MDESLEKLVIKAERRYTQVGSELAKHFVTQFQKAKHPIKGVLRQVEFFDSEVVPKMQAEKTAYVWVDALRFEMARELAEVLKDDFDLSLQPAIGTVPTITEIGMAALLPKASQSAKVVAVGNGKLGLEIAGTVIKDRKDRIAFLKAHAGVPVFDAEARRPAAQALKEGARRHPGGSARAGDLAGDRRARREATTKPGPAADGRVLDQLRRGVRVLADLGSRPSSSPPTTGICLPRRSART